MRMRFVIFQRKIFEFKIENIFYIRIDFHRWKRFWIARQLQFHLFKMVGINMRITKSMYEITAFQSANLRHYLQQQSIRGDVERNAQKHVCTSLVKLQRKFSFYLSFGEVR